MFVEKDESYMGLYYPQQKPVHSLKKGKSSNSEEEEASTDGEEEKELNLDWVEELLK